MTSLTHPQGTRRRRIALGVVLIAAAAPWRYYGNFPLVASFSVLDVALVIAAGIMLLRSAVERTDVGDRRLFLLLCVPPAASALSLLWSQDRAATIRETLTYLESILAYMFAVQQTQGVPAQTIIKWLRRYAYLLLVPSVLMLLHVPGFEPEQPGLNPSSGSYISFFSRLSHPFIGRSNNLATVLALLVFVLFFWGVRHHDRATSFAAFIVIVAIVLTVSRGVILSLLIVTLLYLAVHSRATAALRRYRVLPRLAIIAAAIVAAAVVFYHLNPATHQYIGGRTSLVNVILREFRFSAGVIKLGERPWLGFGAGVTPDNDPVIAGGVHNTYLQQLLAYGVVLGLVVILSLVEVVRCFLHRGASQLRQMVGLTVLAQLIIYVTESSFEGAVLRVLFYLFLGMLVGLLRADENGIPMVPLPTAEVTTSAGSPAGRT
jgi:O-antigen ligase